MRIFGDQLKTKEESSLVILLKSFSTDFLELWNSSWIEKYNSTMVSSFQTKLASMVQLLNHLIIIEDYTENYQL